MKNLFLLASVASISLLTSPLLRAQDVPPPPEQMAPQDQGAPPDQAAALDQNASPDQGAPSDQADQSDPDASGASFQTFYDQLGSQGNWVQTDNYGYVWQPDVQDPDWRPYSNGHWVYTDDGWTWVADASEPWGWATYHYGRWANLDGEGWVWIPGYTWAPAWVSWRYGGGYAGWAPLPPETTVGIDFGGDGSGFHIGGDCDTAYDIGAGYYNFVPVGYIGARNYRPYYVNRYNNYIIINNTRNVTNIVVGGRAGAGRFGRVTTGGPNFATVNAQSRTPLQRASLVRSNRVGNGSLQGNQLAVFAPQVRSAGSARPRNVSANLSTATVNRGASINRPLTVNSRLAPQAASPEQIQAASEAQARIPRNAKVATGSTRLAAPLTAPLTSLRPHTDVARPDGNAVFRPATTSENTPARSNVERADSPFTGGNPEEQTHVRSVTPASPQEENRSSSAPAIHHDATFTPRSENESSPSPFTGETQEHHASAPAEHQESAPIERREVAPTEGQESAPVERREVAPVERQESAPVERREVDPVVHHDAAPAEHHESAPMEHHESAPAASHSAPAAASHPASAPHPAASGQANGKDKNHP